MIVRNITLLVVWVAMWGELSVANVASGVLMIAALSVLFPTGDQGARLAHRVHPLGVLRFGGRLFVDLVVSSWNVALAVVVPNADRIHTEVFDVALTTTSPLVAAIVSNSITLTPGTMTVDIVETDRGFALRVHALGRAEPVAFREQILDLERRVVAAATPVGIPTDGSRAAIGHDVEPSRDGSAS